MTRVVKSATILLVSMLLPVVTNAAAFEVHVNADSPSPREGQVDVSLDATVRIQFSTAIDPESLTSSAMRLLDPKGNFIPAFLQTDLTGGVATLTPTLLLESNAKYTLQITNSLRDSKGEPAKPFSVSFKTTKKKQRVDPRFVFSKVKLDDRDHNSCITVGPDGNLYVADTFGHIKRYQLDKQTGLAAASDTAFHAKGEQIVDVLFDPDATADRLIAWISYGRYGMQYGGAIARVELQPFGSKKLPRKLDYITGLPHDVLLHHQPNGLAFGPDGRLFQVVGGVATLGGSPNWGMKETPLSAAVIVADVRNKNFNGGKLPCRVHSIAPVNYDPFSPNAPVQIFATGFRNAYALCWHSTGHLFTATNQNSIPKGPMTPANPKKNIPAIYATPPEMLYRVVKGKYYGHPNPSRNEYVLNGGNPTKDVDPFEVPEYPVGTKPEAGFDPSLVYNLRPGGGNSANGMVEYRAKGPLAGRLLVAYFSGAKTIQTFAINRDGRIRNEHPLVDRSGNPMRFKGALDVAVNTETGMVYVADFGTWKRPNRGEGGAIWMLEPTKNSN